MPDQDINPNTPEPANIDPQNPATPPADGDKPLPKDEVKTALDRAYAARDASVLAAKNAQAELDKYKQKERDAETERLKAEGKLTEVHNLEKTQWENERTELAKARDAALARLDSLELKGTIEEAIASVNKEFKSERARKTAVREITDLLAKNDKGEWLSHDGKRPQDIAKAYLDDAENSYLIKAPVNSGSGQPNNPSGQPTVNKKVSSMTNTEIMELARKGGLPNQK